MTKKRRTEILLKALEMMSDENNRYYHAIYCSIEKNSTLLEYMLICSWIDANLLGNDVMSYLTLEEKQTLLCLAIAINED